MYIRLGYELVYNVPAPVPMLLMLYTHPSRAATLRQPDRLRVEPDLPIEEFIDSFGNRCGRIAAPAGRVRLWNDLVVEDTGEPDEVAPEARQHPVEDLPHHVLQYLLASRYCEVDLLSDTAWKLFGQTPSGWPRVQAICDWVQNHITFGYGHARPTKTACDAYKEGAGVCRDFMHLAITFCRCMNIPARYATGYLGDIGIPPQPYPMDFSAWFEVYLGGRWYTFDARHNTPRIGRVLMATGRDATDVALTTSFGPATLEKFTVWTDEVSEPDLKAA
jgi:transglutaminase-like putative cysteine protease